MNIIQLLGMGFNKTTADTFSQKKERKREGGGHTFHRVLFKKTSGIPSETSTYQ